jgi:putative MATE family efflux protein
VASISTTAAGGARANLISWTTPAQLTRVILILAIPVAATNALQLLLGLVDTVMCSRFGNSALSAMSIGRSGTMFLAAVFMGLGIGISAYVARLTGAGEHAKARAYATTGLMLAFVLGLFIMVLGLIFGKEVVLMMVSGQGVAVLSPEMLQARIYAWSIFKVIFVSMSLMGVLMSSVSIFNSLGKTMYPMWLLVLSNVANLIGNILLIPRFELAGSQASTAIMQLIAGAVAIYTLWKAGAIGLKLEPLKNYLARAWDLLKLGMPVTLQLMLRSLAMLTIIKLITCLPNYVIGQGALQVGLQAESLAFMPAFAFSTAAATLVGQNLGAKRPDQANLSAGYCILGSQIVMFAMGALLYFFPVACVKLFIGNNAPDIVEPAANFLRILALCLPGLGLSMTLMGVLRGAGDAAITAVISLVAMWGARLPLATYMALPDVMGTGHGLGMGLNGIWWAMTITVYFEAALAYWRFASGRWKTVKLRQS